MASPETETLLGSEDLAVIFHPAALHGLSKPSLPIHRGLNPILHVSVTRFFKLNLRSQSRYNLPSYSKTPHCLKTSICAEPTRSLASTPATLESGLWSLGQRLASLYKKTHFSSLLDIQLDYISQPFLNGHVTQIWHWNLGRNYMLYFQV